MDLDVTSYILGKQAGGSGGTTDYTDLENKPSINDVTLSGNKTSSDLGIQSEIDSTHKLSADLVDDTNTTNKFVTASDKTTWSGKQDALVSGTNIKTINSQSILGSGDLVISGGGDDDFGKVYYCNGETTWDTTNTKLMKIYKQIKADYIAGINPCLVFASNYNGFSSQSKRWWFSAYRVVSYDNVQNTLILNSVYFTVDYSGQTGYNEYMLCSPDITIVFDSSTGNVSTVDGNANRLYRIYSIPTGNSSIGTYLPTYDNNPSTKKYVDDLPTTYTGYDATKTQVLKNINGTLTWVDE